MTNNWSTCQLWTSQPRQISGGYCVGVPPLPIPNREVKPDCADGTAMQCGRVGGRLLLREPWREIFRAFCVYGGQAYLANKPTRANKANRSNKDNWT